MRVEVIEDHTDFEPREKQGVWIYKLDREFSRPSMFSDMPFVGRWLRIDTDGTIRVPEGYAWDGATPKFSILDLVIVGTPDGIVSVWSGKPRVYHATLVHDALYQYFPWHGVSRREIDTLFLEMMREQRFKLSWLYYAAVPLFGGFFVPVKALGRTEVSYSSGPTT